MITDNIRNRAKYYSLGEDIKAALDYFAAVKTNEIANEDIKLPNSGVTVKLRPMETKPADECMFDNMDTVGGKHSDSPSKYLFYNDLFTSLMDHRASKGDNEYYAGMCNKLKPLTGAGEYDLLFRTYYDLANVLSQKAELGMKIRAAYKEDNKQELNRLINVCSETISKIRIFHNSYQERWFSENKPEGFDIQDIRIGGVIQRIESCRERLKKYCQCEINDIPELDEEPIEADMGTLWSRIVTANVISHFL